MDRRSDSEDLGVVSTPRTRTRATVERQSVDHDVQVQVLRQRFKFEQRRHRGLPLAFDGVRIL